MSADPRAKRTTSSVLVSAMPITILSWTRSIFLDTHPPYESFSSGRLIVKSMSHDLRNITKNEQLPRMLILSKRNTTILKTYCGNDVINPRKIGTIPYPGKTALCKLQGYESVPLKGDWVLLKDPAAQMNLMMHVNKSNRVRQSDAIFGVMVLLMIALLLILLVVTLKICLNSITSM